MFCPKCGISQPAETNRCIKCGSIIPPPAPQTNPLGSVNTSKASEQPTQFIHPSPTSLNPTVPVAAINNQYNQNNPYNQNIPSNPYVSPYEGPPALQNFGSTNISNYGSNYPANSPQQFGYTSPAPPYTYPVMNAPAGGRAIAGMILGLTSFITCWIGIIFSILGMVLSRIELSAIRRGESSITGETYAKIGFYTSLAHVILYALFVIFFIIMIIIGNVA